MNKTKIKISMFLNTLIFTLTFIGTIIMFTGFKFMHGNDIVLESTKLGMFKFYTVDSNILMGIVSLLFLIEEFKLLNKKIENIGKIYYILKLIATTAVTITFSVVFAYLGPISKDGIYSMIMNSNLFFHLIIPVLSIISFVFFEKTDVLEFKYTFYGILTSLVYSLFYLINILIHMEDGKVSPLYDWYWFVQNGVWTAIIILPIMILISYSISLILWKLNRLRWQK